jgi:hypothetical protein
MKASWDILQTYIRTMSAHEKRQCHTCVMCNNGPATNCLGKVLDVYWQFAEVGDA